MVSSGIKVPAEVEEAGVSVSTNKISAVVIALNSNSNELSVKKKFSKKMKHPYRACLAEFEDDKARLVSVLKSLVAQKILITFTLLKLKLVV